VLSGTGVRERADPFSGGFLPSVVYLSLIRRKNNSLQFQLIGQTKKERKKERKKYILVVSVIAESRLESSPE
jgi:hypothetical protein